MPWGFVSDAVDYVGNAFSDIGTGISDAASAVGSGLSEVGTALGMGDASGVGDLTQQVAGEGDTVFVGAADAAPATAGAAGGAAAMAAPSGVVGAGGDATLDQGVAVLGNGNYSGGDIMVGSNGNYITPPIPPSLDASGNPVLDASGNLSYPNQATYDAAQLQQSGVPATAGGGSSGNSITNAFNDPSFSSVGKALGNNANWLVPAAALGGAALLGNQTAKGSAQVSQEAAQLSTSGQELQNYLSTGTLPPGVQASINSAAESAKAAVRANYAKMGMSGSSAEIADLQSVNNTAMTQGTQIAEQLLSQGVTDTQISAQLYGELMNNAMSTDKSLVSALGSLAGASARPTINVTGS